MRILIASLACVLLVSSMGCARRQMQREAAMRQYQQQQRAQGSTQGATPDETMQPPGARGGESPGEVAEALTVKEAPQYGQYIVDEQGRALYLFTPDEGAQGSTCYESCAEAWPPALTERRPQSEHPSIRDERIGTLRRDDGTMQLTYNGWPLYYYTPDRAAGQAMGQDVESFGGEWYLLNPEGEKVEAEQKKSHE
jgi:predicted lipoprotein with Yx(FWY)xxD motif